jgi:dolichol-phosphate mannosyltransferase
MASTENLSGLEKELTTYHIAVVIPAYRVAESIGSVIDAIPGYVRTIVVVDDASPDGVSDRVRQLQNPRVVLVRHDVNSGVGGAVLTGIDEAIRHGAEVCVKVDGDGQMDPSLIAGFCRPIIRGEADYVKGNRFTIGGSTKQMPFVRKLGNLGLSFLLKMASGYWRIFDPTNGYVAIRREAFEALNREWIARDYFFESSMLIALHTIGVVVRDLPLKARYQGESSSLNPWRILRQFPSRLMRCYVRRMWFEYFQYDFGMASLLMLTGIPLLLLGFVLGAYYWCRSIQTGVPATGGQVMLSALPVLAAIQMLIQAMAFDMASVRTASQFGPLVPDSDPDT